MKKKRVSAGGGRTKWKGKEKKVTKKFLESLQRQKPKPRAGNPEETDLPAEIQKLIDKESESRVVSLKKYVSHHENNFIL